MAVLSDHVTVIAEAGVNHNGDIDLALALVDAAQDAGADVVKFQTFTTENIVLPSAPKAEYQTRTTSVGESQFDMLKGLELSTEDHVRLLERAEQRGIEFLSTPFDRQSLRFLVDELGLARIKLPSSDLRNLPLLMDAARSGAQIILSTGMASLGEVEHSLKALTFGLSRTGLPSRQLDFDDAYADPQAREMLAGRLVLLHCTSDYPTSIDDVNLRAMATIKSAFGIRVGYSDHTTGTAVAQAAVALGACVIEKHLTLDRTMSGPDHAASCEPAEFAGLIRGIRDVERALGSATKSPTPAELANRRTMRKGLYAARTVAAGTIITEADLAIVRPQSIEGPESYYEWLGQVAPRSFSAGDQISWT
ncbi:MAG: N-acetylneuraminate synthase [Actinobacteria bacterium]|uniref:Unannotated protein n=1 Tax=freshwater metagenome TaxID=449393 RepID=A0A6J7LFN5_9ZZZZ|nr:N-acetylneuraminate synthase [Actinomycetota bacterium]